MRLTAGRRCLAIPSGRGAVGQFPHGVATVLHDDKGGLIASVGLPGAAKNVLAFDGRDRISISVKGTEDHRKEYVGTVETIGIVCVRSIEAVGVVCKRSHCCYWGEIEDYLICCRSKEEKEIPFGVN